MKLRIDPINRLRSGYRLTGTSNERGAMLPIIAVVAVAVLFILIGVGFDTSRVKKVSSELSRNAEAICRDVAAVAVIQRDAVRRFRNEVNDLVVSKNAAGSTILLGTTIVDARLIIPTMPSDSSFCPYDNVAACASSDPQVTLPTLFNTILNDAAPEPPPYGPCNFSCAKYPADCRSDCTFKGNINGLAGYPPQLWNNIKNAGNTAACEFDAIVETTLLGKRKITVKSTWWIPVRGKFDYAAGDVPGLTIAIAPQMTTLVKDKRFQFCNKGEDACGALLPPLAQEAEYPGGDDDFRKRYDPIYGYSVPSSGADFPEAFTGSPDKVDYPSGPYIVRPQRISGRCRSVDTWAKTEADELAGDCGVAPAVARTAPGGDVYSDREEMLTACMNPAILLRNILTASIAEHASRHGQLRMGTEVMLVGTQSRVSPGKDYLSSEVTPPVTVVPFRSDIASDAYQIPFVSYQGGRNFYNGAAQLIDEYQPGQQGRINPFDMDNSSDEPNLPASPPVVTPKTKSYQSLVADQLRYCYHLYDNKDKVLDRIPTSGIYNSGFEPTPADSAAYKPYNSSLRKVSFSANDPWDQEAPWGPAASMSKTRLINASELLSSLGSVQKCPYEQGGLDGNFLGDPLGAWPNAPAGNDCTTTANCNGVCQKPAITDNDGNATLDLRPDLRGLMYYLASQPQGGVFPPGPAIGAVKAPGLFPYVFDTTGTIYPLSLLDRWHPMDSTNYALTPNILNPIIIVTHQQLIDAERDEICPLVAPIGSVCNVTGNPPGRGLFTNRPITVIYIPTHEGNTASHVLALQNFRKAFFIPDVAGSTSKSDNALFAFSPYLEEHNLSNPYHQASYPGYPTGYPTIYVPSPEVPADEWQYYRAYWKDLISAPNGQDIDTAARNIFYSRILTEDIKF